jgi:hypothetical protein
VLGLLSYGVFFLSVVLIFAIAVLGLNLQWGFTGLFSNSSSTQGQAAAPALADCSLSSTTRHSRRFSYGNAARLHVSLHEEARRRRGDRSALPHDPFLPLGAGRG